MRRALLLLSLVTLPSCRLDELLNPTPPVPPRRCYWGVSRVLPDGSREWVQGGEITCPRAAP